MSEWTGVIGQGLPSTAIASSGAAMIGMQSRKRQTYGREAEPVSPRKQCID